MTREGSCNYDSCNYDLLSTITSDSFCNNSEQLLEVLTRAVDSGVFVEHNKVTEVANFVIQHCTSMYSESTGSNELCWAFGEYVKFVMMHHVTTRLTHQKASTASLGNMMITVVR